MNYATSLRPSSLSETDEAPFDILPEEISSAVILFHMLAVDEKGGEQWIQNEFIYPEASDIEYLRTLQQLQFLAEEGTVRNIQEIQRTPLQEWLI